MMKNISTKEEQHNNITQTNEEQNNSKQNELKNKTQIKIKQTKKQE